MATNGISVSTTYKDEGDRFTGRLVIDCQTTTRQQRRRAFNSFVNPGGGRGPGQVCFEHYARIKRVATAKWRTGHYTLLIVEQDGGYDV